MAGELLRFRCYQCGKLLGAPASKAGRTTTCPKCKADLIVPEPNAEPDLEDAIRSLTPRIDDAEPTRVTEPKRAASHEPSFSWEEIDTAIFQSAGAEPLLIAPPPPDTPHEPAIEPPPLPPIHTAPTTVEVDLTSAVADMPGMPEIRVETPPVRVERQTRRGSGDVVLSQSVLVSWSVFVLMALGVSFLAGIFAGHYVWKP